MLEALAPQPPDALLGIIARFEADTRSDKLDLGVGVLRNDAGRTPIMTAVKVAEARLVRDQDSKAYLGPEGDKGFSRLLAELAFGPILAHNAHLAGVQTPGGTGALRLGAELIARAAPDARVWFGTPTWPNHGPIFAGAGLGVREHRFFDTGRSQVDFAGMLADLAEARRGDVVLLHGCCHNPTGAALAKDQWDAITRLCATNGLVPFVDLAYQGLGDGIDADAAPMRALVEAVPEAFIAYSCNKNFGIYRDRVGALWVKAAHADACALATQNLHQLARILWSMPPDHGAAIVRIILSDPALREDWRHDLDTARNRINALRTALAVCDARLATIADQRGMFAMLPLVRGAPEALARDHAIYMAGNGRINISGLRLDRIARFAQEIIPHLADRDAG